MRLHIPINTGIANTITANLRRYIVRKRDQNPDYYDKIGEKLLNMQKIMGDMVFTKKP